MKIFTRFLLIFFLSAAPFRLLFAQLIVNSVATPEELAASLVGGGVTISNVVLNCPDGAWGSFDGTGSDVGMNSGILLACGDIHNAVGPNISSGITTEYFTPGDPDLDVLSGGATNDACVLEFDVTATGDTLKFNYVFGSDEYSEWVFSFNDIFAFLISGPGISGEQNIALVPGTSNPVSINNVNCQINSPYYICNDPFNYACGAGYNCPTNSNQTSVEYDGFTTVLTAIAVVQPCETYHLKLAVADALDWQLDSGVFIEAGSLSAAGTDLNVVTSYVDPTNNQPSIIEGCLDGDFTFTLTNSLPDSSIIYYEVGGTAVNGTDYTQIADSVVILPGETTASVTINPIADGTFEGSESVTLYLFLSCSQTPYDSATIYIIDTVIAVATGDTTICAGQSAPIFGNGADAWSWSPSTGLDCATCQNAVATPVGTTTYTLTITVGSCTASDVVTVQVDNPIPVEAGVDATVCLGQSTQLNASNANEYTWTPSTGLSATNAPNPTATPTVTTTYIVTGVNGCYTTTDTVTVVVNPLPVVVVSPDVTVCPGTPVDLFAAGGVSYSWFPPQYVDSSNVPDPTAIVFQSTTFLVIVTDQFGCIDSASTIINIHEIPQVTVTDDTTIYLGNSLQLSATGGVIYQWVPPTGLSDPNSSNPIATPLETTTYTVTVISGEGCVTVDSVTITVNYDALVLVPSGFSPNGDNANDILHVIVRGIFNLDYFYVFNRWGELIFQTNDVNIGWDGKYKGEAQEVGSYVFVVKGTDAVGSNINVKGNVTLLR